MVRFGTRWAWIACVMAALSAPLHAQIAPGSPFPRLSAADLSGGDVPETEGKVVLVDFWASWCAPCKASFPTYSRLQFDYAARGLVIVAVGVDDGLSGYQGFVAKLKPAFTTLYDFRRRLVSLVQVPTMPTSYLLDRSGKVRFMHLGFHGDQTERELRKEIATLLREKSASQ
jgi:thiol-disulfide isomerase/thioredoxin